MTDKQIMEEAELLPCPFCGGEPEKLWIGNDFTKKRSVNIKCTKCFTEQRTSTIRFDHAQCDKWAIEKWNERAGAKYHRDHSQDEWIKEKPTETKIIEIIEI